MWYDQSAILGSGRIFSTDYWGGYLVYNESVSVKDGTGELYVDGVLVEGAGVHDFGGVVITVIE
ncbi:MAG: hypothetical protein LUC89_04510 [Oscillospiraceae bacterium]|nr:hypothetical protein [Oscillospiraceae bacterium]